MNAKTLALAAVVIIIVVAAAVLFMAPKPTPVERKVLRVAMGTDIVTLDPHDVPDNPSIYVIDNIYEGLVEYDDKLNIKPVLAERWEISPDGKVYTFYLRKGVKFQDGTPFNAQAVKANFDRLFNNKELANRNRLVPFIDRVEVVDDYTVRIILKKPVATFLNLLCHPAGMMISPKAIKEGVDLKHHPVGTGPYKLKEWKPNTYIELEPNPDYWGGTPKLAGIKFLVVPEDEARVQMVESGDADVSIRVPAIDVQRLKQNPDLNVNVTRTIRIVYIGVNMRSPRLQDKRVRQAISLAIDREAIVEKILHGVGRPAKSVIAEELIGFYDTGKLKYDPERAKQLIREAGAEGLQLNLWTPKGRYPGDYEAAQAVAQYLEAIGLKVKLRVWEWGSYVAELLKKPEEASPERDLFLIGWAPSTGEYIGVFRPLFLSESIPKFNLWFYSNPKVDELIKKAEHAPRDEIVKYTKQIQEILLDDLPAIPIYNPGDVVVYKKGIKSLYYIPTEVILTKYAYFGSGG